MTAKETIDEFVALCRSIGVKAEVMTSNGSYGPYDWIDVGDTSIYPQPNGLWQCADEMVSGASCATPAEALKSYVRLCLEPGVFRLYAALIKGQAPDAPTSCLTCAQIEECIIVAPKSCPEWESRPATNCYHCRHVSASDPWDIREASIDDSCALGLDMAIDVCPHWEGE